MEALTIYYKNHQGETRQRKIFPLHIWYGKTEYHPAMQWFMRAIDMEDDGKVKDFALKDFLGTC